VTALGRNDAYLQQFLQRGSPRRLPEEIRHQLAGLLGVEVSAGGGGFDYVAEDTTAGWPFDRSLLGTIYDGAPDDLRLVIVRGESMTPLQEDGDMVLVNTADTQPSPPGIFVLFDGIGLMVKSLELLPGSSTAEPLV